MKTHNILTTNREIYTKFSSLNWSNEIILRNVKPFQVERILKNINKDGKQLDIELHDKFIIVKKINDIILNVYLR